MKGIIQASFNSILSYSLRAVLSIQKTQKNDGSNIDKLHKNRKIIKKKDGFCRIVFAAAEKNNQKAFPISGRKNVFLRKNSEKRFAGYSLFIFYTTMAIVFYDMC